MDGHVWPLTRHLLRQILAYRLNRCGEFQCVESDLAFDSLQGACQVDVREVKNDIAIQAEILNPKSWQSLKMNALIHSLPIVEQFK